MEGFQYATTLDLNMGYYTIQLSPKSKDLTTIVTEFGKFRCNVLPMGLCISGGIFQAKVNELLGDIEGLYAYIDDILLTIKGSFDEHLQQLRTMRVTEPIASGHSSLSTRHYVNILTYKHHNIHTIPFYNDTFTYPDINVAQEARVVLKLVLFFQLL